jgi:hypothetical protein
MQQRQLRAKWLLYSTRFFCVREFIKTESQLMLLHSCALDEHSSGSIWKFRTSSFKCYVDHSHTMYSSGNTDVRNWVRLFELRCINNRLKYAIYLLLILINFNTFISSYNLSKAHIVAPWWWLWKTETCRSISHVNFNVVHQLDK